MNQYSIIAIGASAGGITALRDLVAQLPASLPAALLAVVHTASDAPGLLGAILDKASPLPAKNAEDGMLIQPGHIYVAPPDHHLLTKDGKARLVCGPRENLARPAIDPLFRSVAVNYGPYAIGIILSGNLDDGTAGLWAIKQCNGMTMVQCPDDALYPDMPAHALKYVQPDYCLPLADMGAALVKLLEQPVKEWVEVPKDIALELEMMEKGIHDMEITEEWGQPALLSCPNCGGPLWELNGEAQPLRYRCHVGHGYTVRTLLKEQNEKVEEALWVALRTLKERSNMLQDLADREKVNGRYKSADVFQEKAYSAKHQAEMLKNLLEKI